MAERPGRVRLAVRIAEWTLNGCLALKGEKLNEHGAVSSGIAGAAGGGLGIAGLKEYNQMTVRQLPFLEAVSFSFKLGISIYIDALKEVFAKVWHFMTGVMC